MALFKRKNQNNNSRNRVQDLPNKQSTAYNYLSNRSVSDIGVGRYNLDTQQKKVPSNRGNFIKHIPTYIAVIVLIVCFLYTATLSTNAKVVIVDNTTQSFMQPISVYQDYINKILSSSVMNYSKLSINTDSLAQQMNKEFPELNGVSIIVPLLGRTPMVEIRPSRSIINLTNAQGSFLINQQGNAIIKLNTNQLKSAFNLPVVKDESGLTINLGSQILPLDTISFINTVIDQYKAKNIQIQSITLAAVPYELDVQARGEPYYVKYNLLDNSEYEIGTYFSTLKELSSLKQSPTQYIDVRIPGRAYYK